MERKDPLFQFCCVSDEVWCGYFRLNAGMQDFRESNPECRRDGADAGKAAAKPYHRPKSRSGDQTNDNPNE
jgi:hypothetical protein